MINNNNNENNDKSNNNDEDNNNNKNNNNNNNKLVNLSQTAATQVKHPLSYSRCDARPSNYTATNTTLRHKSYHNGS
jgi:hypothetical protein